jgi:hypothetical protein
VSRFARQRFDVRGDARGEIAGEAGGFWQAGSGAIATVT